MYYNITTEQRAQVNSCQSLVLKCWPGSPFQEVKSNGTGSRAKIIIQTLFDNLESLQKIYIFANHTFSFWTDTFTLKIYCLSFSFRFLHGFACCVVTILSAISDKSLIYTNSICTIILNLIPGLATIIDEETAFCLKVFS